MRDVHSEFRAAHAAAIQEMAAAGLTPSMAARSVANHRTPDLGLQGTRSLGKVMPSERPVSGKTSRQGGSTGRVATLPGADPEYEVEAYRTNAVVSSGDLELLREWASLYGDEEAQDAWWAEHYEEIEELLSQPKSICGSYLVAPPAGDCGACSPVLRGNDSTCHGYACDKAVSAPDMETYAPGDLPIRIYDLRGVTVLGYDAALVPVLKAAWTFLTDNLDLVRWALCYVEGADTSDCIPKAISGDKATKISLTILSIGPAIAGSLPGIDIVIYGGAEYWEIATTNWACGDNANKACVALDVAATLLHELTHTCLTSGADLRDEQCKYDSYLTESVFRWALFNRYASLSADCCGSFSKSAAMFAATRDVLLAHDLNEFCSADNCVERTMDLLEQLGVGGEIAGVPFEAF